MELLSGSEAILSRLILVHHAQLTERTVNQAYAQVPWLRQLSFEVLQDMISRDYEELARMLATNNVSFLRAYIERTGRERLRLGAQAESLIALAILMEDNVRRLIDSELAPTPAVAKDATRRLQTAIRNIRMILSGLNLRQLIAGPAAF